MSDKKHFMVKLIPNRSTFAQDITQEEVNIMLEHAEYWRGLMTKGMVVVFGPVYDEAGIFGLGIIEVDDDEQVKLFTEHDPAVLKGVGKAIAFPMRATVR